MGRVEWLKTLLGMINELRDRLSAIIELLYGIEIDEDFRLVLRDDVVRPLESALISIDQVIENLKNIVELYEGG